MFVISEVIVLSVYKRGLLCFITILFVAFIFLDSFSLRAYADYTWRGQNCATDGNALDSFDAIGAKEKEAIEVIVPYLAEQGWSKNAICGCVSNLLCEGLGRWDEDYYVENDGGSGPSWVCGMMCWTDKQQNGQWVGARTTFKNWCTKNGKKWDTLEGQCDFLVSDACSCNFRWIDSGGSIHNETHNATDNLKKFWSDIPDCWTITNTGEFGKFDFDSPEHAAEIWCWWCECPSVYYSHINARMSNAKMLAEHFSDLKEGSSGNNKKSKEELAAAGISVSGEFLAETDFVEVSYLTDTELPLPQYSDLNVGDTFALKDWKEDVESKNEGNEFSVIRAVVILVGILVVLYSVAIFIAYQFDTNQGFIDIELVSILTLGHLRIAPNEESSTYTPKKEGQRLITQKDVYFITILGISLGILIISGKLYILIANVIQWITNKWSGT